MHPGGIRTASTALLLSAALLGGCTGDDEPSATSPTSGAPSSAASSAAPSPSPGEDEAVAVVRAFWQERIRVETSGDYDSADFSRVMTRQAAEPTLERYSQLETGGFHRVGEPELRDLRASVEGDTAVATVCVNEDEWGAEAEGEPIEIEPTGWYAEGYRLEVVEGRWVIVGDAEPDANAC